MTSSKKSRYPQMAEIIIFLLIILLFIVLIAAIVRTNTGSMPKAENGVVDLSGWDFEKQGTVSLSGNWAFYWNEFADPEDYAAPDLYAKVPDVWNNYEIDGEKLPGYGYATYILRIEGVQGQNLSMRAPPCSTAYELYIDGRLLAKNGTVSSTSEGFVPEYEPENVTITTESDSFTITLIISNYVYARGGAWYSPVLGTSSQIEKLDRYITQTNWFLLGSFITISLLCFCIFILTKRNVSILLFAVLALVTALRTTVYGAYILSSIVPYRLVVIADYLTLIWMPSLIVLFILSLSDEEKFKKLMPVVSPAVGILTIFVAAAPINVFTQTTIFIEIYAVAIPLYGLYYLLKSKSRLKAAITLGVLALLTSAVFDVLYQNCILVGVSELSPIGFFIMLCTWGIVLAKDYTDLNEHAKQSAEKAHAAEIAFLQAQIRPHFLYNTLNVISTLCRLDGEYAEKLTLDLSKYLQYFMEFKNLSKFISFSAELEFVETYVKIETARFVDEFNVIHDLCDTSGLAVPPLSIQPLVENAIRHGVRKKEEFGTVVLSVRENEKKDGFIIEISDDGVGIEPSKLEQLNAGIQDGNSVGLINVKRRIDSLRGTSFVIKSELGRGTRIVITMPRNVQELNEET
ncbi:MAG: hypothetical protein EOM51_09890 [Clostridia bacterium]|nr:hypothetical protein [Clostridia bacterium]